MTEPAPCIECRDRPKWRPRHRCIVCHFRHQPIAERIAEAHRRRSLVPDELVRARVPKTEWPDGERWCASCQSFVPLEDCTGSMCKPCSSERSHAAMIEKTYGLDAAGYEALLELQGGRCAICRNRPGKKKRLAVDHDHQSGAVRGLLCGNCNHNLLGAGYDSPLKLLAGYHYLNTPPATGLWTKPEDGLQTPGSGPTGSTASNEPESDPLDPDARPQSIPAPSPLASTSPYEFVGSSKDDRGRYLVYIARGDNAPPF